MVVYMHKTLILTVFFYKGINDGKSIKSTCRLGTI